MTVEVMPLRASRERSSTGERQSGGRGVCTGELEDGESNRTETQVL